MSFNPGGGGGISAASDVALSNPTSGHLLSYDAGIGKWGNDGDLSVLKAVVKYDSGTNTYPARPSGYASVEWIGPVDPGAAAQEGDTWINTV